jgi:hypothetical protein
MANKSVNSVWEKATNERYVSHAAEVKHERGESAAQRKKEYGKSYKKGKK